MPSAPAPAGTRHRIGILINDMTAAGGIQRVAANLAQGLRPWHDTMIISVEPVNRSVFPGADLKSLEFRRSFRSRFVRSTLGRVERVLHYFRAGRRLQRLVAAERIDTVFAIWYDWATVAALMLPASVKRVGCEHIAFGDAGPKMQRLRRYAYPKLDAVVALTQEDLGPLSAISRRALVIPNYPRVPPARPGGGREKILLVVGHIEKRKGQDRLLLALRPVLMARPEWKLVMVGGGEDGYADPGFVVYLNRMLRTLQLEGRAEIQPATKHIADWYARAGLYVMGSRREGLPMVLIEAKSFGLPVVAFDCPTGPREIVRDGVDGFLVPDREDDLGPFAERVAQLMDDDALRERMGEAARADSRFSTEVVLGQWRQLVAELHGEAARLP